jgi:molybdenum cofactor cytidylyltransferase
MTVGALLLAAGQSRRMGTAKLALPVDGVAIVARTHGSLAAAGLPVLLVTGAHEEAILAALPEVPHIHAEDHAKGLSASLNAGLAAAPPGWTAALVMLGDMPFVRPETLKALAAALDAGAPAVQPVFAGRPGNPAGFARALWPRLGTLSGDRGAGDLLRTLGPALHRIAVEDPGIHRDLDTPEDLKGPLPSLDLRTVPSIP